MSKPYVSIWFDGRGCRRYAPGETLAGSYRVESVVQDEIKAVEISVLWYTDGKGSEDLSVHMFKRLSAEDGDWIDTRKPGRFRTVLPNSPLSYDGAIVKIRWCVRVRVFLSGGKELVEELPFMLGEVAAVRRSVAAS